MTSCGVGHNNLADSPMTHVLTLVGRLCSLSMVDMEMGAQLRMAMVWFRCALVGGAIPCHIISRAHLPPRSRPRRCPVVALGQLVVVPLGPMGDLEASNGMMVGPVFWGLVRRYSQL